MGNKTIFLCRENSLIASCARLDWLRRSWSEVQCSGADRQDTKNQHRLLAVKEEIGIKVKSKNCLAPLTR